MRFEIRNPNLHFPRRRTRRQQTSEIIIHHLHAHWDVHRTHQDHLSRGWNGIGYNIHVAMSGAISLGRGLEYVGAHKVVFNSSSIGIGCEGRYDTVDRVMPDAQFNALVWLISHLRELYGDLRILGHRDYAATACPGRFFPMDELRQLEFRGMVTQDEITTQEDMDVRYNTIEQIPIWARETIQKLIQSGVLRGNSEGKLDLSMDMIRLLIINERAGLFEHRVT